MHTLVKCFVVAFACAELLLVQVVDGNISKTNRDGKLLSLFQVITFSNEACIGSGNKNGTCYTAEECSTKMGTSSGPCAQGYGVCCTFTVGCGGQRAENCTYFESQGNEVGGCVATICPCSSNICQMRLDFEQFTISGPSTSRDVVGTFMFGEIAFGGGGSYTTSSQCLTDSFTISNPSGAAPPTICGINTGEHMYVDAFRACSDLNFVLGNQGVGSSIANRVWNIKVTQYSCDFSNLAPEGCTQYFFGPTENTVQTFNFQGSKHLADQSQNICIRRERGNCRICFTTVQDTDFGVSGTGNTGETDDERCCGYTAAGGSVTGKGYDCVFIPGARKQAVTTMMNANAICGMGQGLVTNQGGTAKTICSSRQPFSLRFQSDRYEAFMELGNLGFKLAYLQNAIRC